MTMMFTNKSIGFCKIYRRNRKAHYLTFAKQNNVARIMQSSVRLRVLISHDILCSVRRLLCNSQHREFLVCSNQQKTMPNRNVPHADLHESQIKF